MKIVVTGGLGFIGSHFVTASKIQGHEIVIVDKLTYAGRRDNLAHRILDDTPLHVIDIADSSKIKELFHSLGSVDWIVNFAAESHVDRSIANSLPFVDSNVRGVVNLLEIVRYGGAKNMLQVSTDEVYGSINNGSWSETAPISPRSPYSASKASAELFCQAYFETHGINILITRCANNFGPKQAIEKLIPKSIYCLMNKKSVPIFGNGLNSREWIFVEDHVSILTKLIELNLTGFHTLNIGGVEFSNLEIVRVLGAYIGVTENFIELVEDRLGHDFRYSVNDSKMIELIGWKKKTDIGEQLAATLNWYLGNSEWIKSSEGLASQ